MKWREEKNKERRQAHNIYIPKCRSCDAVQCTTRIVFCSLFTWILFVDFFHSDTSCSLFSLVPKCTIYYFCHCMYFSCNDLSVLFDLDLFIGRTSCVWLRCNDRSIVRSIDCGNKCSNAKILCMIGTR